MNTQIQKLLDLPQMVNGMIKTGAVNSALDQYDSNSGVRRYTSLIYQWAAFLGLIVMEVAIVRAAYNYFTGSGAGGLAMAGSVLSTLVLVAFAFPIANLIRVRGESLGSGHQGMVSFLFGDFVKTNIRLLGELAAVTALAGAIVQTLSFLLDTSLFSSELASVMGGLSSIYTLPMELFSSVLRAVHLGGVADMLFSATNLQFDSGGNYDGDFRWNIMDLWGVAGAYINILVGLAFMYVSLAIYGFMYNLAATFLRWVSSPSLPISVRNK